MARAGRFLVSMSKLNYAISTSLGRFHLAPRDMINKLGSMITLPCRSGRYTKHAKNAKDAKRKYRTSD
jgi:hypothetical protein